MTDRIEVETLTPRDVAYARRWFVSLHFWDTTPARFESDAAATEFFDSLCEDNALSVEALKRWAANMYSADETGEEYRSHGEL
jgi:hypothetical protein